MRRLVGLAIVLAGSVASARPVVPPAAWTTDAPAAISMSKQLADLSHFGGLRSVVTTEVYRAQGASLFVTRASASVAGLDEATRNKAATTEVNELLLSPLRGTKTPKLETQTANAIANPAAIEAATRWSDPETGVITSSRIVVAADPQHVVAVTGECVLAAEVAKDLDAACAAALATLDPEIVVPSRVALAIVEKAGPVTPPAGTPPPPAMTGGPTLGGPSLVESGKRPSLPPMQIEPERQEPDRRPIYVGFGLVLLAVIFYFNRKNREKLEREYEKRVGARSPAGGDQPEAPPKPPPADHDADDLHAAAAGDDGTKESKS